MSSNRCGVIASSTIRELGTWSPSVVLHVKDEVESRGGHIDHDADLRDQALQDIKWIQENKQKQRLLPMP